MIVMGNKSYYDIQLEYNKLTMGLTHGNSVEAGQQASEAGTNSERTRSRSDRARPEVPGCVGGPPVVEDISDQRNQCT